jgi:hypothetical protein
MVRLTDETNRFYDAERHLILRRGPALEIGGRMKSKMCLPFGILTLALTVPGIVITPMVGYAQTDSKERRDDRQGDRKDSRDTKQDGRQDARTNKAECKKGDEKTRSECRQDSRDTKQDSRGTARDIKKD